MHAARGGPLSPSAVESLYLRAARALECSAQLALMHAERAQISGDLLEAEREHERAARARRAADRARARLASR